MQLNIKNMQKLGSVKNAAYTARIGVMKFVKRQRRLRAVVQIRNKNKWRIF